MSPSPLAYYLQRASDPLDARFTGIFINLLRRDGLSLFRATPEQICKLEAEARRIFDGELPEPESVPFLPAGAEPGTEKRYGEICEHLARYYGISMLDGNSREREFLCEMTRFHFKLENAISKELPTEQVERPFRGNDED